MTLSISHPEPVSGPEDQGNSFSLYCSVLAL
jgi:hypothetical protein